MKRTKIKTDNVEQLMEIVRSLQRGEEPTQESIEKRAERMPVADAPTSDEAKHSKGSQRYAEGSEKEADEWDAEDDAFVRSLEETDARVTGKRERLLEEPEEASGAAGRIAGLWQKAADYLESRKAQRRLEKADEDAEFEETDAAGEKEAVQESQPETEQEKAGSDPSAVAPEEAPATGEAAARPAVSRPWRGILPKSRETRYPEHLVKKSGYTGASRSGLLRRDSILADLDDDDDEPKETLTVEPESQNVFERIAGKDSAGADTLGVAKEKPEEKGKLLDPNPKRAETPEAGKPEEADRKQDREKPEENGKPMQEAADHADSEETGADTPEASDAEDDASVKIKAGTKKRRRKTAAEKEEEIRKGFAPQRRTAADVLRAAREYVQDWLGELKEKGITRRELAMIGAAAVFVILLIVLIVQAVSGSIATKRKSENVTADAGLHITVEDEPENWSSSYPVQLKISVTDAVLQSVQINGADYTLDEAGLVTVEADTDLLEVEVQTDQGTRSARIELPKLDGEPPVVHASLQNDRIELTAADARSSVRALYYAVSRESELGLVPQYQKYTEPISYTEGLIYRFYAEDAAGNRSTPIVTNMKTAQSLTVAPESLALYPGETVSLDVKAEPEYALLENLQYESQNPELISVSDSGTVTALANGTGAIRITADGVSAEVCTVEVADSRTVTISAVGDCTLGTDENFNTTTSFNAYESMNGMSYFFQNVRSILEADDATFANFEGTLTTATARESKEYAFKGDPSYTQILEDGSIDVVTLANNHSSDYGSQSLTDTEEALDTAGIDYCIGDKIAVKDVNGIPTAFIGIYVLNDGMAREDQVKQTIAAAKQQGAKLIIVAFHWGTEKASEPDETQKSLAHTAIDCGADLVVGHHPHVLQAIECYKGKYIAYSLGNFCFGGNSAPSDMDTMIFQQTFTVGDGAAETKGTAKIVPCSISSAAGYNDYQPTPAEGDAKAAIIERINTMSADYHVTVSEDGTVTATETQGEE